MRYIWDPFPSDKPPASPLPDPPAFTYVQRTCPACPQFVIGTDDKHADDLLAIHREAIHWQP
jgi:hypothetical protein